MPYKESLSPGSGWAGARGGCRDSSQTSGQALPRWGKSQARASSRQLISTPVAESRAACGAGAIELWQQTMEWVVWPIQPCLPAACRVPLATSLPIRGRSAASCTGPSTLQPAGHPWPAVGSEDPIGGHDSLS